MKKLNIVLFLAGVASLTSCLKAGKENLPEGASPMTVQWTTTALDDAPTNSASALYRTYARSFDAAAASKMDIAVDITGGSVASSDITVGVTGVNAAAVAAYNAKYFPGLPGYTMLPTNLYTMPTSVVIPSGGRTATVSLVLNTAGFDFSKSYVIPVTITSTTQGQISGNYGTVFYLVSAKNAYDANYTTTGYLFHPTAGRTLQSTKKMSTIGAIRVEFPLGDLGSSGYLVDVDVVGSTVTNYAAAGATPVAPSSGLFTADHPEASGTWSPATPGVAPFVHTTYNNTYNAATKTFYLHYGYGVGSSSQSGWSRQVYEMWVRQ